MAGICHCCIVVLDELGDLEVYMREWSKMKIMIFNKKFNFEWMAVSIGTERGEVFIIIYPQSGGHRDTKK